jgi:hypothetical protein
MTWKAKLWKVALLPSKEASTFLLKRHRESLDYDLKV